MRLDLKKSYIVLFHGDSANSMFVKEFEIVQNVVQTANFFLFALLSACFYGVHNKFVVQIQFNFKNATYPFCIYTSQSNF